MLAVVFIAGAALGISILPALTGNGGQNGREYQLRFVGQGTCAPPVFVATWGVVLDNRTTVVEPASATLPISNTEYLAGAFQNRSMIVFSVPEGVYTYSVAPTFVRTAGTITISGGDVNVTVPAPPVACTTTLGSTT